jgi:hypothetical protein
VLAGKPRGKPGSYTFTVNVVDANGAPGSATYTLKVKAAPKPKAKPAKAKPAKAKPEAGSPAKPAKAAPQGDLADPANTTQRPAQPVSGR